MSRSIGLGTLAAVVMISCASHAMAADRGGRKGGGGYNNLVKPVYGGGHHHGGSDCGGSKSSFSLSIGVANYGYGTGWASGFGYSSGYSYGCGTRPYGYYGRPAYCAPPVVVAPCPPPVVVAPPCPPPVVVVRDTYCPPPVRTVVVSEPVVVQRPVYVERPVVVEKQVVVERVVERPVPPPPPPAPEQPAAPQSGTYRDRELGDAYLRHGDMANAARVYSRYLSAWDKDGTATRNLGLAQIGSGAPREGFSNVVTGYKLEPNLINRPLRVQDVGGAAAYSALLDQAARSADGLNNPDGWLTVAILQRMNGRTDAAVSALQKAREAGLDTETLDAFTLAMSR
ncbi:MAG: hypothetical protein ACK4WH_00635 [Phycisphaerales bacterium]